MGLQQFCQNYLAWIEAGAPEKKPYSRKMGLCGNAEYVHDLDISEYVEGFPFGGRNHYYKQMMAETQHTNPERLAWVKEHAQVLA